MKLIAGQINGEYLLDILNVAKQDTESVWAAVAYATDLRLFDWCVENSIPVKFWGRIDETVPVVPNLLNWFLSKQSANYSCKLIEHYHPKVIWWRGYGVYIGSANLTNAAWFNNVELGVFYSDDELLEHGIDNDLSQFFKFVDSKAFPITRELVEELERQRKERSRRAPEDKEQREALRNHPHFHGWPGLTKPESKKGAKERKQNAFLREWTSTLEILRSIAQRVSADKYRPSWIAPNIPAGSQADQFLHAHYYENTFDGRRADYERHFTENAGDPEAALKKAMEWWSNLPNAPNNEDRQLNKWAPEMKEILTEDNLRRLDLEPVKNLVTRVHSMREFARRVRNEKVSLPGNRKYAMDEKTDALSAAICASRTQSGLTFGEFLSFVLYGGSTDETPVRLCRAVYSSEYKFPNVGVSALGEIVGWAMPDEFPPRNGRTSKALRSLGFDVDVHVG